MLKCYKYKSIAALCFDRALFTSQEAPEDDPQCGVDMLKQVSNRK